MMDQIKFGDYRQMIRCDKRRAASVKPSSLKTESSVKINMIEMEQRQNTRIRPRFSEMQFWFDAFEFVSQKLCRQAVRPFVEIARDNAFAG